jgi:DNA ligase-associated metallophosphoesterase
LISDEDLLERLQNKQACITQLAGNRMLLDASGVMFWPAHKLLIFSDLHFEKGSFLSQFANPLPRFDTQETLERMRRLLQVYQPQLVVCLGDSFHDANAINRMESTLVSAINTLVNSVSKWYWVLGNHDPDIAEEFDGESVPHLILNNILLVHEPEKLSEHESVNAQIIGHFHPKLRTRKLGHTVSGKCFVLTDERLLMPAFGQYTGGLSIEDKAIKKMLEGDRFYFLLYAEKIFMVNLS